MQQCIACLSIPILKELTPFFRQYFSIAIHFMRRVFSLRQTEKSSRLEIIIVPESKIKPKSQKSVVNFWFFRIRIDVTNTQNTNFNQTLRDSMSFTPNKLQNTFILLVLNVFTKLQLFYYNTYSFNTKTCF